MIESFLNVNVMARVLPAIISGLWVTLALSILVIASGTVLGLALATLRAFQFKIVNLFVVLFVDAFRAIPPLVILIVVFFALPYVNVQLSGFVTAWLCLSLVLAAFSEEIFWASILSVDKGQWEAALSTGFSFLQTLWYVVLPQAMRLGLAPLTNRAIAIGKSTALASVVAVPEILNQASSAQAQAANASPLTLAAIAYLVIFLPLVALSRWVESRFSWRH
ncbi:MAG: amino acid ABC transporter permease [Gemmatimonadota bacterium]|nr:amino acid ABC transporter permease [Gemmatimonadota bacterium]